MATDTRNPSDNSDSTSGDESFVDQRPVIEIIDAAADTAATADVPVMVQTTFVDADDSEADHAEAATVTHPETEPVGEVSAETESSSEDQPPVRRNSVGKKPAIKRHIAAETDVIADAPEQQLDAVSEVAEVSEDAQVESPKAKEKPTKVKAKSPKDEPASPEVQMEAADPTASSSEEQECEFRALGLRDDVFESIQHFGYKTPTPIQKQTVEYVLAGRDVIGSAETGSGKTAAFAWPLLSNIDLKKKQPQILVVAPTRELAIQVTMAFEKYGRSMKGLSCVTVYGGQSYEPQLRALRRGVQVVVGTPGRLMDHMKKGSLRMNNIRAVVLDEADEMLRMGFINDVEWILEQVPKPRQILTFSATMPEPIQRIAREHLNDPKHISIKSESRTADSIEQKFLVVPQRQKMEALTRILETEPTDGIIVFTKTKTTAIVLSEQLALAGYPTAALHGDIAQNHRERSVNQLKSGKVSILVATDVAARGLDVSRVSHVINYDFPHDTEAYIHRIGRTGRAGRDGNAILFVEPREKSKFGRLEYATGQAIKPYEYRSVKEVNELRVTKFREKIESALGDKQMDFFRQLTQEFVTDKEVAIEDVAAAVAILAQGDTPLLLEAMRTPKAAKFERGKDKKGRESRGRREDLDRQTWRVEVGKTHNVGPGNLVGAIANEAGLDNGEIGKIKLFDNFSLVDLPSDLPTDIVQLLSDISVGGQRLRLRKWEDRPPRYSKSPSKSNNGGTKFAKSRNDVSNGYERRKSNEQRFSKSKPASGGKSSGKPAGQGDQSRPKSNAGSTSTVKPRGKSNSGSAEARKYVKVRGKRKGK